MRQIDREEDLERINRVALKMAREVANSTGTLMAGGLCSSKIYHVSADKEKEDEIRAMFEEQVEKNTPAFHTRRTVNQPPYKERI